ncbi:hypothetical protein M758_3G106000 [Ceratodon purpureus]|uniref:HTH myb-type domain-containing protein n=1 Tax=Ceratodon purpureus TaxID=3225 RepID=A0A8T0IGX3_CERPU|nr:hypothetical protein KC19_3G103700 [Ceratodon purpureus]KAG0622550.1 hypothetical protein M758_3G106000 [Ceratodon purpureus]
MASPPHLTLGPHEPTTPEMEIIQGPQANEMQKLDEYLRALQEERGKVEAFKRELPLCMQLIDEAIETAKQRVMEDQCSPTASLQTSVLDAQISDSERSNGTPILENFMPLKRRWEKQQKNKNGHGELSPDSEQHHKVLGRPEWTREAQLWTQQSDCIDHEKASSSKGTKRHVDFGGSEQARTPLTTSRLHLSSKNRQRGAFLPFVREKQLNSPEAVPGAAPDSRVSPADSPTVRQNGQTTGAFDVGGSDVNVEVRTNHGSDARMSINQPEQTRSGASQSQRKARRCWSPELHRRFVSVLQQLGGSQVATPKQIRELMKVDGLTNDEVKSHLQKYRLHTRPSPSPSNSSPQAPQLVVLGWMRPDQFQAAVGAASQASTGGACDDPPLVIAQNYIPPQSTEQPQMQLLPVLQKHVPVISTSQSSLPGPSSVTGGSPNSSSDSYMEEADDVQERRPTSSGHIERQLEDKEHQLQPATESKGSTTCLVDIGIDTTQIRDSNTSHVKLHNSRKIKAAA